MSRTTYTLSDETRKVLTDHVAPVAEEWDKDPSYLYQILSNCETDCFSKFRSLYAACVRAGVSVTPWDAALSAVKKRYRVQTDESQCLSAKITLDADTTSKMVTALRDGVIDQKESDCLRIAIQRERDSLDELEGLLSPVVELREWARESVNLRAKR